MAFKGGKFDPAKTLSQRGGVAYLQLFLSALRPLFSRRRETSGSLRENIALIKRTTIKESVEFGVPK